MGSGERSSLLVHPLFGVPPPQELVEQHRVYRFVATSADLAIFVPHY